MSLFITFEGIEGCGKTTQVKLLADRLATRGFTVTVTREPGGCAVADRIRAILLDPQSDTLVPLAELLLYAAARAQHVEERIRPALARGEVVLCDRFTDATVAYQGRARELDLGLVERLNYLAAGGLRPDLTILLDCPVEVGLGRAMARIESTQGPREERFEQESFLFHEKVRNGYLAIAQAEPARVVTVRGDLGIGETTDAVTRAVENILEQRCPSPR